jgi:glycosyltransferase involved in cell wall biosynthesis
MLAILTTHPIQYQVPLWQLLARDGKVPFEVWYLTLHATQVSRDREFQRNFAWDIDMLSGYRYRLLRTAAGATPNRFWRCRVTESLAKLFQETKTKVLWVQGWQVAAYWQAVWAAKRAGVEVWLRGESNILRWQGAGSGEQGAGTNLSSRKAAARQGAWRERAKRIVLEQFFKRVDHFLCIGTANRELYRSYGVPESKLHMAPYAVDNERFRRQADALRGQRSVVRSQWSIPEESFCVLFCGKFIPKKHPMDVVCAAQLLITDNSITVNRMRNVHLLFVGSGELGAQLRAACNVFFDAEAKPTTDHGPRTTDPPLPRSRGPTARQGEQITADQRTPDNREPITNNKKPRASFAGFLNQTQVSKAYVAADVLVLPSDYGETWGLVVNEAMASGLPCIISDRCGCASDLGECDGNAVYQCGRIEQLAGSIAVRIEGKMRSAASAPPSLDETEQTVRALYAKL